MFLTINHNLHREEKVKSMSSQSIVSWSNIWTVFLLPLDGLLAHQVAPSLPHPSLVLIALLLSEQEREAHRGDSGYQEKRGNRLTAQLQFLKSSDAPSVCESTVQGSDCSVINELINWTLRNIRTHPTRHQGIAYYFFYVPRWIEAVLLASRPLPLAPLAFCHLLRCFLPKYSLHICNLFCLSIWAILNFVSLCHAPSSYSNDKWTRPDRGCLQF